MSDVCNSVFPFVFFFVFLLFNRLQFFLFFEVFWVFWPTSPIHYHHHSLHPSVMHCRPLLHSNLFRFPFRTAPNLFRAWREVCAHKLPPVSCPGFYVIFGTVFALPPQPHRAPPVAATYLELSKHIAKHIFFSLHFSVYRFSLFEIFELYLKRPHSSWVSFLNAFPLPISFFLFFPSLFFFFELVN